MVTICDHLLDKPYHIAKQTLIQVDTINQKILLLRNKRVMLDSDLAELFGTTTKKLNQSVKRNAGRFPEDFMFQLTLSEKKWVVANCDHLEKLKFSPAKPYAFTEHGAIMIAAVLNTPIAIQASVQVVRAFVKLRELLNEHQELARRLDELEGKYDAKFAKVFKAIRKLMEEPQPIKIERIGFRRAEEIE